MGRHGDTVVRPSGAGPKTAQSLACSMAMMLEGAFMLSLAARDPLSPRVADRSMAESSRTAIAQACED